MDTRIRFVALPTAHTRALQAGGPDANGQTPGCHISSGVGTPCRHCLEYIGQNEEYLVLSYRPFPAPQPYAEQGPIFLHASPCHIYQHSFALPSIFDSPSYLIRGYNADDRIVSGSGQIVATHKIFMTAQSLFENSEITYIHVRSASNNCYMCRIERG